MKALSDVKANKIIRKIQAQFAAVPMADAIYEVENLEEFHAALIEQASSMAPGSERMVYFYDSLPFFFVQGYGIVKLYHHESWEQGGSAFVAVDIFSAGKRHHMSLIENGTWSCTPIVQIMTSADCYSRQEVDDKVNARSMDRVFDSGDVLEEFVQAPPTGCKIYTVEIRTTGELVEGVQQPGEFYSFLIDSTFGDPPHPGQTIERKYYVQSSKRMLGLIVRRMLSPAGVEYLFFAVPDDLKSVYYITHVCGYN